MSTELRQALERVAGRFRRLRLWGALAACWLVWAIVALGLGVLLTRPGADRIPGRYLLGAFTAGAGLSAVVAAWLALRSARDPLWVARRIEARHPELDAGLLAAVEHGVEAPSGRLGFLQEAVVGQALEHRKFHDWDEAVSSWALRGTMVAHAAALAFLLVAMVGLVRQARTHDTDGARYAAAIDPADVKVEPGNAEIERGTSLLVVARFGNHVPADARLIVEDGSKTTLRRGMTRSLEDPTFAGRVESVDADLAYRVEFDGRTTETYRVKVFEYPELQRADARLAFPSYTALEPKTVEDIRHVTAVEGTELTLLCHLNKDVTGARLVDEQGQAVALAPVEGAGHVYRATFPMTEPRRYRVQLVDREGRGNKLASEVVVNVTRNRPAVVKTTQPAHDVRVSPLEELKLKAELEDDFGLVRQGFSYALGGQPPKEVELPAPKPNGEGAARPSRRLGVEHLLDFEKMKASPDQLVTYFFWAEDIGPDGQPRRSSGDMYFAEVRHFEEIFRQGEQAPAGSSESQGQGQNAQQAEQLAELQKQIINGTWTLIRRETGPKPTDKFAQDAEVLRQSQHSAIEQAAPLAERLRDAKSKASLELATRSMTEAETRLAEAAKSNATKALGPALAAEQAAYQALLRLRAREFEVTRGNRRQRGQGGGQAGGPSQRQLDQLELSAEENRYEEQRSARAAQENLSQREREQRETRQVLNRLRELAQRQADLNERLKELQSALEAAKNEPAREEIQRQLKRLREQQQQILRDTDELRERMENEQNRDRMAEAREQIEQGREHVRQASEALEQGRLSQAITEGARAGRQLSDLREQVRKDAANRFSETMTEMRNQARQLDEDQKKLSDRLDSLNQERKPQQPGLRDSGERKQVREGLGQQRQKFDGLTERMQRTVEEAEETEPLLAKGLYDTVRKAAEQKVPDALNVAEQLTELGVTDDAARASRHAAKGIEQMREGVERAAESVLGDETSALRRAQGELEDLADQIDRELAQATGRDPNERGRPSSRRQGQPRRGGDQPRPDGQPPAQDGQPQDGQPQGEPGAQGQDQPQDGQPGEQGQQGQSGQRGQQKGQRGQRGQQGQQKGQQGQQQGQQGGQQGGQGGQDGQQQGGQDGQPGQGGQQGQGGLRRGNQPGRQAGGQGGGGDRRQADLERMIDGLSRGGGPGNPITGEGFRQWSDRMRDVEELLNDPELRAEAARIRDRVRGAREEFKRHAKMPDPKQLTELVAEPIEELRDRVAEEVRRRESPDSLVPIDRDPVPPQYAEGVRRYYERLGTGR